MTPRPSYPALSLLERGALLAIVVVQFLFAQGPIWRRSFHWDRAILWSYATIPLLVIAWLAVKRRLTVVGALLHTLELTFVKFMITALTLGVMLAASTRSGSRRAMTRSSVPSTMRARGREDRCRSLPRPGRPCAGG